MKQTPLRLPAGRHTHPHTRARAAGLPAACVRGGPGSAHTAAGGAERGAPPLSSARPLPRAAARSPPPTTREQRPAARRPERRLHTPPRHAPRGSGRGGAATSAGGRGRRRAGDRGAVQCPVRPDSADQVGLAGRRPSPRRPELGPARGAAGVAWGAAGMRSGLLLRPCPVSALPVSSLLFLSLSLCPSPCPYPVPAAASAQPPGSPEGLRRGSPHQVRGMGAGEKRPGGHGVGPPSPRNLERSEGSVPSCGAGHRMALAPDRTGRGCPWEGGAWEGKERGA